MPGAFTSGPMASIKSITAILVTIAIPRLDLVLQFSCSSPLAWFQLHSFGLNRFWAANYADFKPQNTRNMRNFSGELLFNSLLFDVF
jgi:hypothetical protein